MIDRLLSWFAPHICKGCTLSGIALCERCKNYVLEKSWRKCVICQVSVTDKELAKSGNLCEKCRDKSPFAKVFVAGERNGILKNLVGDHKYFSERQAARAMAELLAAILPSFPEKTAANLTIIPLPTIQKHIRERGFDHMKSVARHLSQIKKIPLNARILRRTDNISQHSANFQKRTEQAARTFSINPRAKMPAKILLIDDIYTTGATVTAAAKLLKKHGAAEIWLGILARQTDKSPGAGKGKKLDN